MGVFVCFTCPRVEEVLLDLWYASRKAYRFNLNSCLAVSWGDAPDPDLVFLTMLRTFRWSVRCDLNLRRMTGAAQGAEKREPSFNECRQTNIVEKYCTDQDVL